MYGNELNQAVECCTPENMPTAMERLVRQKSELLERIDKIDKSIKYLEKNPDFQEFLTCIRDVGCL